MRIDSKTVYYSVICGAKEIIKNKDRLNEINVFPVNDGDTGNNLSFMMKSIIDLTDYKSSVKETLSSIAEAAIDSARGNSGIIFAQYLLGLSKSIEEDDKITMEQYASASIYASEYAYNSILKPVEGTIITVMKEWGESLKRFSKKANYLEVLLDSFERLENAVEKTKEQLLVLKKANVVDSGAKAFNLFIKGVLYYLNNSITTDVHKQSDEISLDFKEDYSLKNEKRYCISVLVKDLNTNIDKLKSDLKILGESIAIAGDKNKSKIHIHTNDTIKLFDLLYSKGDIIDINIEDMHLQYNIINNRKSKIALITDSIADISDELINKYQIYMLYLDILHKESSYIDRLSISQKKILEIAKNSNELPTSSRPSLKRIKELYNYLLKYYDSIIVLSVSSNLSGTYESFKKVSEEYANKIDVIDTKQNSASQGLLVKKCAELIFSGISQKEIVKIIKSKHSKILVQVNDISNIIKSGRISRRKGAIANFMGLKPIVSLDEKGRGVLDSISFTSKSSMKKIINHIEKINKKNKIESYNIVYVENIKAAEKLSLMLEEVLGFKPLYIKETSSIVAIAAGKDSVAVSYILK